MAITAAEVNKLRQITGAGMMDCKNALTESNGDFDAAIDILRKKGQKVASKRSDREASEGVVLSKTTADGSKGVIVMLNCETDFVARNQEFIDFAESIVNAALENFPQGVEDLLTLKVNGLAISEKLNEMVGKIGEKIEVSQYGKLEAAYVCSYNHPGYRLASMVGLSKKDFANSNDVAKDIAMQIAAMSPVSIDRDDCDPQIVEKEKEIAMELARNEGKPENMLEKIATGRVEKFYKESTLLNQEYIKDNKKTVKQFLTDTDKDLKVTAFHRFQLAN